MDERNLSESSPDIPTPLEVAQKSASPPRTVDAVHGGVGVKSCPIKVKTDGMTDGEFLGYASVFGVKDTCRDVVQKGAFAKTPTDWEAK